MTLQQLITLITWDIRINRGFSWDRFRATTLLIEVRIEQYIYRKREQNRIMLIVWYATRFAGSILQWFLCNSEIPGSVTIGRGLRLPHPQNIVVAGFADIGEFCTIYHNVSIAWNGFKRTIPLSPKIGSRVLIGAGVVIVGDLSIGSDVLIGAGAIVSKSVPEHSRVTSPRPEVTPRHSSPEAAEPGSARHLQDPYSIWR